MRGSLIVALFFLVAGFYSCTPVKNIQYLQGGLDTNRLKNIKYQEPVIQEGDILSISVYSANAAASALYNQQTSVPGTGATLATGYPVDSKGNIQFPGIGEVKAKGLTREQLALQISSQLSTVLTSPVCLVRFNNFKVTLLGEVNHPSVYNMPTEKVTILEAIGLAGDLTTFARRDSVLVIRELDNQRQFGWLNLNKTEIFESPYYYLRQNDVVVVNPTKNKAAINDQVTVRNITLGTSILSTIAILITVLKK